MSRRLDGGDQGAQVPALPAPKRGVGRDVREVVRDEPLMRGRLLEALADGPLTVPELAEAVGAPADEVMVWTMGLRKYGWIAEQGADGEYFRYARVER